MDEEKKEVKQDKIIEDKIIDTKVLNYQNIDEKIIDTKVMDYTNMEETLAKEAIIREIKKEVLEEALRDKAPVINNDGVIEGNFVEVAAEPKKEAAEHNSVTENTYYSETIKNKKKPKAKDTGFKRFIAGVLVASIIGGPMIGVGSQLAKPFAEKIIVPMLEKTKVEEKENIDLTEKVQQEVTPTLVSTNIQKTNISPAVAIAKAVGSSVVSITSTVTTSDFMNRNYNQESGGSGIIFDSSEDGKVYIVTNNHVIENATKVIVTLLGDQKVEATLVGADSQTDLAVISVDKSSLTQESVDNIVVATFGDSSSIQVGELAIAIGNPLGDQFNNSTTQGVISGVNRQIQVEDRNLTMIQTDAAINPGNSGGALANSKGEVIGINTVKYTDSTVEGMGFAIPTNIAMPIIEQLMNKGYISRPYLGIMGRNVTDESQSYFLPIGVLVSEVASGSGAEAAGMKPEDIIIAFDGEKITSMEQLTQLIKKHAVGDEVVVRVLRDGKTAYDLNVVLQDSKIQTPQTQPEQQEQPKNKSIFPFGQ